MEFTLEDLAEAGVRWYLDTNRGFFPGRIRAEMAQKNDEQEDKLIQLLKRGIKKDKVEYEQRNVNSFGPQESYIDFLVDKNLELLLTLPKMLYLPRALEKVEETKDLVNLFALMLVKLHKGTIPEEVELDILNFLGKGKLQQAFIDLGYNWSNRAMRRMERQWPELLEQNSGRHSATFDV